MKKFTDMIKLENLKDDFCKQVGLVDKKLTDNQLNILFSKIEKYPEQERNLELWQKLIRENFGISKFKMNEGLDLSDINLLHLQIQALLKK